MRLQHQRGDNGDEIGIAAALADAVERALDVADAGIDGGKRIGHGVLGVVMGMDAEMAQKLAYRGKLSDALDLLTPEEIFAGSLKAAAGRGGGRGEYRGFRTGPWAGSALWVRVLKMENTALGLAATGSGDEVGGTPADDVQGLQPPSRDRTI